jgi:hypothetical protein
LLPYNQQKRFMQLVYVPQTERTGPCLAAIFSDGTAAIKELTLRDSPWEELAAPRIRAFTPSEEKR